jgi:predicted alpha/beta-hydrolase family hydrolase
VDEDEGRRLTRPVAVSEAVTGALELDTPHGPARAHLHHAGSPRAALLLGHGAGGGVGAPDLVAVTRAAVTARVSVALVEQPYRVAGRRSPPAAGTLDAAFTAVAAQLADGELSDLPLVAGGRSSGARVACRTAAATGAVGVLCLAFPLIPPRRRARPDAPRPPSRLPELEALTVPVLVVQGRTDPFGMPSSAPGRTVVEVDGDHSLRKSASAAGSAAVRWLDEILG